MDKPDMTAINADDYRNAPAGDGPQSYQWADKPHRLVYDLSNAVDQLQARVAELEAEVKAAEEFTATFWDRLKAEKVARQAAEAQRDKLLEFARAYEAWDEDLGGLAGLDILCNEAMGDGRGA